MSKVKIISELTGEDKKIEVLFWVGCAGAYDARAQKVSRAFAELLTKAEVNFAILGNEEMCTGDPARRAGNEFVFQMLAQQNITTLNQYEIRAIVTTCPHCFNTLKNEYSELGGEYEVYHYSTYLKKLISDNRLNLSSDNKERVAYHDSCYLGRVNNIYDDPRELINKLGIEIKELEDSGSRGLCCGAGGGQMFKENEPGNIRINTKRAEQIVESGMKTVVANCPFCLTMLTDGLKALDKKEEITVIDLSELILNNVNNA